MRQNKKKEIIAAAIRVASARGIKGCTVRQIAREAGVTEGALYRHFDSKAELCQEAYSQIVEEMASLQERILEERTPIRERFREWVRVSYDYFDRYPQAFEYVLLKSPDSPEGRTEASTREGRLMMQMIGGAIDRGELPSMRPEIAMSHFSGILLNVPRLINEGILQKPASQYADAVADAIDHAFGIN